MSDLHNSVFDDEKELLERQRLEYKNALLNDVGVIKDQTTQIGKGALALGGALAGVWMVSKLIGAGKKKKKSKKKKAALKKLQAENQNPRSGFYLTDGQSATGRHQADLDQTDEVTFGSALDFNQVSDEGDSAYYNTPAKFFNPEAPVMPGQYSLHNHYYAGQVEQEKSEKSESFIKSDFVKLMGTQVLAFALVYLSKKAEEFVLKNTDIATKMGANTHQVDYTDLNSDAGKHL